MEFNLLGKTLYFDSRHFNMGVIYNHERKILYALEPKFRTEYYSLAENPEAWGDKFADMLSKYIDLIIDNYVSFLKQNKIFAYNRGSYIDIINNRYVEKHLEDTYRELSDIEDNQLNSGGLFSKNKIKKLRREFLKKYDTYGWFLDCLIEVSENSRDYTINIMEKETENIEGKTFRFARISKDKSTKADNILDNIKGLSQNDKIDAYIQAVGYDYLNEDIYDSILLYFPSELENVNRIKKALFIG
ncbi:hypothetical protein HMPREF9629_01999 [Peptoanaerobacter stomatis]|uniref:Uncharacterized protein n=1 Tax=Peptoanaerobacter stomatis TaxID=796937 RepID=G9X0R3_9FIRM|nr:hypothetical protein [Peptoanaerobacter stomatis]EHL15066.1 hypothetical protein HMPREF9629_01999 [Peptoanaerobacter stomatis]